MSDPSFAADAQGLARALALLLETGAGPTASDLRGVPAGLPATGVGEQAALETLAPLILGGARRLGAPDAFAHMDPPTPWVTWAATLWNAALNQNLLHPDTAPVARAVEARVIDWLAPVFGMDGGHLTAGSTLANLTAIWAARELRGIDTVVASGAAHLSVRKAAHLLGLAHVALDTDRRGALDPARLPDLSRACLVLTAGTTAVGAIDPLRRPASAAWVHVDAAWAGPLRLSERLAPRLAGIEQADSVAVSAHKWLFQPKDSALVLFRDTASAHPAISAGGGYLAAPNVGVLGSHGAVAVPLLATLLAWGRQGLARRVERCVDNAHTLAGLLADLPGVDVFAPPLAGVFAWRPAPRQASVEALHAALPPGVASVTTLDGGRWLRHVAANPNAVPERVFEAIRAALSRG